MLARPVPPTWQRWSEMPGLSQTDPHLKGRGSQGWSGRVPSQLESGPRAPPTPRLRKEGGWGETSPSRLRRKGARPTLWKAMGVWMPSESTFYLRRKRAFFIGLFNPYCWAAKVKKLGDVRRSGNFWWGAGISQAESDLPTFSLTCIILFQWKH